MCSQVAGTAWGLSLSSVVALHPAIQLPSLLSTHVFHKIPKQASRESHWHVVQAEQSACSTITCSEFELHVRNLLGSAKVDQHVGEMGIPSHRPQMGQLWVLWYLTPGLSWQSSNE